MKIESSAYLQPVSLLLYDVEYTFNHLQVWHNRL